ncbi:MAG: ABC transporter ATP-binding protein, partial [Acidobacteriota bacterium]
EAAPAAKPKAQKAEKPRSGRRRLSYKERRDLESLPERIEALEEEQGTLHGLMADPELYKRDDAEEIARAQTRLKDVEQELELAYERWTELETLAEAAG